jgi:hypothetical protein
MPCLTFCLIVINCCLLSWKIYHALASPPDTITAYRLRCLPVRQLRYVEQVRVTDDMRFLAQSTHAPLPRACPPDAPS